MPKSPFSYLFRIPIRSALFGEQLSCETWVHLCMLGVGQAVRRASLHRSTYQVLSLSSCKASSERYLRSWRFARVNLVLFCCELQVRQADRSAPLQMDLSHPSCTQVQNIRMGHIYQLCWPCITPSNYLLYLFPLAHYDMI